MVVDAVTAGEMLALLAEREGVLLAEAETCGDPLMERWLRGLTPGQHLVLEAYELAVEHHHQQVLTGRFNFATTHHDGQMH